MKKLHKKPIITNKDKGRIQVLIESVMNKDYKTAHNALKSVVNTRLQKKMQKIAQTEDLI